jgi:3D (Asp-Asp-Asp) domain-containing protein
MRPAVRIAAQGIMRARHILVERYGAVALAAALAAGCRSLAPPPPSGREVPMTATAYCACRQCCSWTRSFWGRPVYATGSLKGKPKQVGVCADGTRARKGTIAADTRYYPFGTAMYVPGYGRGRVHDTGGDIKGPNRIDLFFPRHSQALQWGRRRLTVVIVE